MFSSVELLDLAKAFRHCQSQFFSAN